MQQRMNNPAMVIPEAMGAIQELMKATYRGGLAPSTMALSHLRASQINGCSSCVESGVTAARKAGETEARLATVSAWRDAPHFTEAERAALALTESVTRLADRPGSVSDEIWEEATRHFDETQLAALLLSIATTNLFNRLNAPTRQVAGSWAN